jgi:hypothetical protein
MNKIINSNTHYKKTNINKLLLKKKKYLSPKIIQNINQIPNQII